MNSGEKKSICLPLICGKVRAPTVHVVNPEGMAKFGQK